MSIVQKSDSALSMLGAEGKKRCDVLIIDDHTDSLFYAQQALELFGYQALTIEEGHLALEAAKECQPSIIFLDICLRDTNGFDVLRQLKCDKQTAHIPVVAATALVADKTQQKAKNAGFSDFLAKPYMLSDLESILNRHIKKEEISEQSGLSAVADSTKSALSLSSSTSQSFSEPYLSEKRSVEIDQTETLVADNQDVEECAA